QPTGHLDAVDFPALTRLAEDRVEATTGLRSLHGPAHVRVIDRAEWIRANIDSFRQLLDPVIEKWATAAHGGKGISKRVSGITGQVTGAEVGAMLGWMSGRVLGQYDLLFGDGTTTENETTAGAVYLVGPNMLLLEQRFGFDSDQFRL